MGGKHHGFEEFGRRAREEGDAVGLGPGLALEPGDDALRVLVDAGARRRMLGIRLRACFQRVMNSSWVELSCSFFWRDQSGFLFL